MPTEHTIVCSDVPMVCANCIPGVKESALTYFNKTIKDVTVKKIKCNPHKKRLTITFTTQSKQPIENYMQGLENQLNPAWWDDKTKMSANSKFIETKAPPPPLWVLITKGGLGITAGAGILALPFFISLSMLGMSSMILIGGVFTLYLGAPALYNGLYRALLRKKLNMDSLFFLSGFAALGSSIAHLFFPAAPMLIEVGLLIFGFRYCSEAIKSSMYQVTKGKLFADLLKPKWDTPDTQAILLHDLKPGDTIVIQPGDKLPVNGRALGDIWLNASATNGQASTHFIAGMPLPQGGVYEGNVPFNFICDQIYEDSYFDQMDESIEESECTEAPIQARTQKFLNYFIPVVLLIAMIFAATCYFLLSPAAAIKASLYVLASACPCIFGLIPSLGMYIGVQKCKELEVSINDNAALEQLKETDKFVLDLNGTMTTLENKITQCTVDPRYFDKIGALEARSSHPIAKVIAAYCGKKEKKHEGQLPDSTHHGGINDGEFFIGNADYLRTYGYSVEEPPTESLGQRIHVGFQGEILGFFEIEEPLQTQAKATIHKLKSLGKTVILCSGAAESVVKKYARALGIDEFKYAMSPEAKKLYIENLQENVCMVGDGTNDLLALLASQLGIGISSPLSDDLALSKAKINLPQGQIHQLIPVLNIAQDTQYQIYKNLSMSLGYNAVSLIFVVLALFYIEDFLNPAIGSGIMVAQSACALGSLWYWQRQGVPENPPCHQSTVAF